MNIEKRIEDIRHSIKRNLKLKEGAKKILLHSENHQKSHDQSKTLISKIDNEIKELRSEFNVLSAQINTLAEKTEFIKEENYKQTDDRIKEIDLNIEHYRKQLDIENQVKDGIQKMLNASKTSSSSNLVENKEIFLLYQDSVVKTESLKMLILRETQKKQLLAGNEVGQIMGRTSIPQKDGYEVPRLVNLSTEYLKNRIEVTQKLLDGAKELKKKLDTGDDKKNLAQSELLIVFLSQKLGLLKRGLERRSIETTSKTSEELKCMELFSKNAVMSGTLMIKIMGVDDLDQYLITLASHSQSTSSKIPRKQQSVVDLSSNPWSVIISINIDSKLVYATGAKPPSPTCFGDSSTEIILLKNREIEFIVKCLETGAMIGYNSLSLLEFLDGEEHINKIPLEPCGSLFCKVKYIVPRPRTAKIVRQKRIFAKSKPFLINKNVLAELDIESWTKLLSVSQNSQKSDKIPGNEIELAASSPNPMIDVIRRTSGKSKAVVKSMIETSSISDIDTAHKPSFQRRASKSWEDNQSHQFELNKLISPKLDKKESVITSEISISSFKFLHVLGQGHFGRVLLAQYMKTGEKVAIKSIPKFSVIDNEDFDMINTEKGVFVLATEKNHPFLVHLLACLSTDQHICFVMEHVSGGDLMTHIHIEIFSENRTIFYSGCVLLGLQFLHNNGIIYRDLKLDNLMLDSYGYVKIGDFGLCKSGMWHGVRTATFCGTPEFIAPEILEASSYTRSVDWWELGVLIYEMLIGESPFPGEDENEIFESILYRDAVFPPYLSDSAKHILSRLICKDPQLRLGSTKEDALEIRAHSFYSSLDFYKLYNRAIVPDFVPQFKKGIATYIDEEFINEKPVFSTPEGKLNAIPTEYSDFFKNFSYTSPQIS